MSHRIPTGRGKELKILTSTGSNPVGGTFKSHRITEYGWVIGDTMILYTHDNLEVGQRVVNGDVADMTKEWNSLTFIVKREVTLDDYLNHLKEIGYDISQLDWNHLGSDKSRFFEIMTD